MPIPMVSDCLDDARWLPDFSRCRPIDVETENTLCTAFHGIGCLKRDEDDGDREEEEEQDQADSDELVSIIRKLIGGVYEVDVCFPQVDRVREFCAGVNQDSLRSGKGDPVVHNAILLDDRSCGGARSGS